MVFLALALGACGGESLPQANTNEIASTGVWEFVSDEPLDYDASGFTMTLWDGVDLRDFTFTWTINHGYGAPIEIVNASNADEIAGATATALAERGFVTEAVGTGQMVVRQPAPGQQGFSVVNFDFGEAPPVLVDGFQVSRDYSPTFGITSP